jgi:RND superfamily putative drug exporter
LILIPTLLRVFGRHAWALPRWLDRILPDVRFGHGQAAARLGVELAPAREQTPIP